jgi:hypothetical protein
VHKSAIALTGSVSLRSHGRPLFINRDEDFYADQLPSLAEVEVNSWPLIPINYVVEAKCLRRFSGDRLVAGKVSVRRAGLFSNEFHPNELSHEKGRLR